jgi:hypothetical protein
MDVHRRTDASRLADRSLGLLGGRTQIAAQGRARSVLQKLDGNTNIGGADLHRDAGQRELVLTGIAMAEASDH